MMDNHRRLCIHADPSSATPAEIQSLAEDAYAFARTRATKTLRDEFAMAALPAVIAVCGRDSRDAGVTYPQHCATKAYEMADAMMGAKCDGHGCKVQGICR